MGGFTHDSDDHIPLKLPQALDAIEINVKNYLDEPVKFEQRECKWNGEKWVVEIRILPLNNTLKLRNYKDE